MKYWEIIADNLSKAGWSWGCVSGVDSYGRGIFVANAHRANGKPFLICSVESKRTGEQALNRQIGREPR
jgi:hypothetical protein